MVWDVFFRACFLWSTPQIHIHIIISNKSSMRSVLIKCINNINTEYLKHILLHLYILYLSLIVYNFQHLLLTNINHNLFSSSLLHIFYMCAPSFFTTIHLSHHVWPQAAHRKRSLNGNFDHCALDKHIPRGLTFYIAR